MSPTGVTSVDTESSQCHKGSRDFSPLLLLPPTAALCYPLLLSAYHASLSSPGYLPISGLLLMLAAGAPLTGVYVYWKLGSLESASWIEIHARRLALLCVGAPPLYTALGVLLAIAHDSTSDFSVWLVIWIIAIAMTFAPRPAHSANHAISSPPVSTTLRVAHGIGAAVIVCIFLVMHLSNHLAGLWSVAAHRMLMNAFRHVYRAGFIEPILVGLFVFQIISGTTLAWQYTKRMADLFRTLQISSGAYLLLFVPGHMNSVFVYARAVAKIPTDRDFAVGAPTGILRDAWNIRLLPHYLLGVFFVVTHLVLGARVIALGHNMREGTANRLAFIGIALAAVLALAIMAGMVGIHIA